jgi:hypothetical protein
MRNRNIHVEDDIVAPTKGNRIVTVARTETGNKENGQDEMSSTADNFDGIDWPCLPGYMKQLVTVRAGRYCLGVLAADKQVQTYYIYHGTEQQVQGNNIVVVYRSI